jgi:hypothetical protein
MTRLDAGCSKTAAECHPGFAPVGKQAPPARAAPSLVRALRDARGALLFATGTKPDPTPQRDPFACRLTGRDEETALSRTKKQHFANDVPPAY